MYSEKLFQSTPPNLAKVNRPHEYFTDLLAPPTPIAPPPSPATPNPLKPTLSPIQPVAQEGSAELQSQADSDTLPTTPKRTPTSTTKAEPAHRTETKAPEVPKQELQPIQPATVDPQRQSVFDALELDEAQKQHTLTPASEATQPKLQANRAASVSTSVHNAPSTQTPKSPKCTHSPIQTGAQAVPVEFQSDSKQPTPKREPSTPNAASPKSTEPPTKTESSPASSGTLQS